MGEAREPRTAHDVRAWQQTLDDRPHGRRPEHEGLLAPATMQDSIGKDVSALEVGAKLNLVHGEECHVEVARHCLDR